VTVDANVRAAGAHASSVRRATPTAAPLAAAAPQAPSGAVRSSSRGAAAVAATTRRAAWHVVLLHGRIRDLTQRNEPRKQQLLGRL
jgi:hypothetical protein